MANVANENALNDWAIDALLAQQEAEAELFYDGELTPEQEAEIDAQYEQYLQYQEDSWSVICSVENPDGANDGSYVDKDEADSIPSDCYTNHGIYSHGKLIKGGMTFDDACEWLNENAWFYSEAGVAQDIASIIQSNAMAASYAVTDEDDDDDYELSDEQYQERLEEMWDKEELAAITAEEIDAFLSYQASGQVNKKLINDIMRASYSPEQMIMNEDGELVLEPHMRLLNQVIRVGGVAV